jgi:hypothetical protein
VVTSVMCTVGSQGIVVKRDINTSIGEIYTKYIYIRCRR